jgi:hypothetical protein
VSDESSQTNPEVSPSAGSQSPTVGPAVRLSNSSSTDPGVNVRPVMVDVGVDNGVRMSDNGTHTDSIKPSTTDAATNTPKKPSRLDTEEQVASREWVKAFYKKFPNWVALRIHPIKKKDSKDDKRYVIDENGALISRNGKKYKRYEYIDWVATMEKIKDMYYDAESQSIDETHGMLEE